MPVIKELNISPVIRSEGDLQIRLWVRGGEVVRAHTQAVFFNGLEKLMAGKPPHAGLQMTPRICGVCGGSHLYSAAFALENACHIVPPSNALIIRGLGQMLENLQSIPRWFYTQFAVDLVNEKYAENPVYEAVKNRFAPYIGAGFAPATKAAGIPIQVYGLLAGPWPGAGYMIPGGVVTHPGAEVLAQARVLMDDFRKNWLEAVWLGDTVERYLSIDTWDGLLHWANTTQGDLPLFIRAALAYGIDRYGGGAGRYLAFGAFLHPERYNNPALSERNKALIIPSGFFNGTSYSAFDPMQLQDNEAYTPGGKIPRFHGLSAEVGALAHAIMQATPQNASHQVRDPLFGDIMRTVGPSAFVRALARLHEMVRLVQLIDTWLDKINPDAAFSQDAVLCDGIGFGATEAARGALAHWMEIENGLVKRYRIMPPTVWNVGPLDETPKKGPIEAALLGLKIDHPANPVEVGHIVRSFDTCLVSIVQVLDDLTEQEISRFTF